MEPVHVKEALSFPDKVHLQSIINMVEGITIRSKKQTSILIIFHC